MKFRKALIYSDDAVIRKCDVVDFEGKLWLVPYWLESPSEGVRRPIRIIRIDSLPLQNTVDTAFGVDLLLKCKVPISLLGLASPKEPVTEFEVRELPNLAVPLPDRSLS